MEENVPCKLFACQARFKPTGDLICQRGHFNRPQCKEMPCGSPPSIRYAVLNHCYSGAPSGAICEIRCQAGYVKTSDLLCDRGSYSHALCLKSTKRTLVRETLSAELCLNIPYHEWASRAVEGRGINGLHLMQEIAKAASVPVVQLLRRDVRTRTKTSMVLNFDVLQPSVVPFDDDDRAVTADTVIHRVEAALQNSSSQLHQFLRKAGAEGTVQVLTRTLGAPCRDPPEVANSEDLVACGYSLSGQRCPLVCVEYHESTGDLICFDGTWTKPRCVPVPCEEPRVNNSANVHRCNGLGDEEQCMLECMPGYIASGPLTCSLGSWTGGSCVPRSCRRAALVPFGNPFVHAHCAGMLSEEKCAIRCGHGTMPTDSGFLMCDLGNWRHFGTCSPAPCLHAPVVRNSVTDFSGCVGMASGQDCLFTCAAGFEAEGILTCVRGQFLSVRCVPSECTGSPVIHGLTSPGYASRCSHARSGEICEVDCGTGRELSNPVICINGRWSSATCILRGSAEGSCPSSPLVPRAANMSHCAGARSGDVCHITCEPGYKLSTLTYCLMGAWTPTVCEPQSCETSPSVEHSAGTGSCAGLEHGAPCTLFCLPGYSPGGLPAFTPGLLTSMVPTEASRLVAATRLVCDAGRWVGARCLESPCDSVPPGLQHAVNAWSCVGTPSGSSCKLLCEVGYQSSADMKCVRGSWDISSDAHCKEIPCLQLPNVPHSRGGEICINTESGAKCPLECEEDYFPSGLLQCQRGIWLPMACLTQCRYPSAGISGGGWDDLSHCAGTPEGGHCKLMCLPGFRPTGELRCLSDGSWEIVDCYDVAEGMQRMAMVSFQLSSSTEQMYHDLEIAAESFRSTTSNMLRLSRDLVSVSLEALEADGKDEIQQRIRVAVLCNECHTVCRRLSELLERPRDYLDRLFRDFCAASCAKSIVGRSMSKSCQERCKWRKQVRVGIVGDVAVIDLNVFDHDSDRGGSQALAPLDAVDLAKDPQDFFL
eukprot:TRINITY_DN42340_c0_g2_i1.p1 TRINITY_DN42340_c0_g2~~TRINITY_DN42340_c0_g2_i1.p1  ORF type:complete len:1134 (-),score=109.82 TRINITY_DN42340_c0_g2_i1:54-3020(-)